eukprot:TRINITY_DN26437_c0_g1_i3.p1 TRINITY_DN26437_c0_g1~~TRINITY_DN26437_c0_g1_i3.p1  ORF type:complete len:448 (+),score=67.22 TRINITY_DN26437_c0_g1_i3:125-1345(+)
MLRSLVGSEMCIRDRFDIDPRWYNDTQCCIMRWDCIAVVCKDASQSPATCTQGYDGVFTASPLPTCPTCPNDRNGFGLAESDDGLAWTALPPITQGTPGSRWPDSPVVGGEVGSVSRLGGQVYVIQGGMILVAPSVLGPYAPAKSNLWLLNLPIDSNSQCTNSACWSYPRMWDVTLDPSEPLTLMTSTRCVGGHTVNFDMLKQVTTSEDGTIRAKWWNGNSVIRGRPMAISSGSTAMLSEFSLPDWDMTAGMLIEVELSASSNNCVGVLVSNGSQTGWVGCWMESLQLGLIGGVELAPATGSYRWIGGQPAAEVDRGDLGLGGGALEFKMVARTVGTVANSGASVQPGNHTMIDVYVNEYLLAVWTLSNATGQVGLVGIANNNSVTDCANCSAWGLTFRSKRELPM